MLLDREAQNAPPNKPFERASRPWARFILCWGFRKMRTPEPIRPNPERLLKQVQAEESKQCGAKLKIFLGYAPGVGKSYRMLDEARRRFERGEDVVVGAVQGEQSADIKALLQKLEQIPSIGGAEGQGADIDAILRRAPQVCVIDPLAVRNPPASRYAHRWQDVQELLRNGISVLSSVNLLFVEEYREKVRTITGKDTSETIPKSFLLAADEIVIVDVPTDLCLWRQGKELTPTGISNLQERQLSDLRELALLLTAEVVDAQLESYVHEYGIEPVFGAHERFLICMTAHSDALTMIERGESNRDRFQGELYAVHVRESGQSERDRSTVRSYLDVATEAGAITEVLESDDPISAIIKFARDKRITQIFIGHSTHQTWRKRIFGDPVRRLIREAEGIDVRVFPRQI
jgi:two-component system sensor histidine kinase KdpD